jgi:hypothetical protein
MNKEKEISYCENVIRPLLTNYTIPYGWGCWVNDQETDLGVWWKLSYGFTCGHGKHTIDKELLEKI